MEEADDGQEQYTTGNGVQGSDVHSLIGALAAAATAERRVACLGALESYLTQADDGGSINPVHEAEVIASSLKAQLKNANQFVVTKALAVTATFSGQLAVAAPAQASEHGTPHQVRASVHALLPSLVERLADHREKSRETAKGALVDLTRAAAKVSPAQQSSHFSAHAHNEVPLAMLQRILTEIGLNAKSAKVKEQAILLLPALRQAVPRLHLRPFLSALVEHLGDADPHVREASRSSCIFLFSTASQVAKAELKKEMDKHAVRKQTADAILAEVLSTESAVEAPKQRLPSAGHSSGPSTSHTDHGHQRSVSRLDSTMSVSKEVTNDVAPVYIASRGDLERALLAMEPHFAGKETENNWLAREHDIVKIRGMIKTSVPLSFLDTFGPSMKHMQESILKAASSLRTTLSVHGLALIEELAECLGDDMDSLADGFIGPLLKMASSTKKLVVIKSQQAAKAIFVNVSFKHKFLDHLWQTVQDKNVSSRISACQHLTTSLQTHATHRRSTFEHHGGLDILNKFCKRALPDQNKDVRAWAREAFYQVEAIWPDLGRIIMAGLDAATKRQVETGRGAPPPPTSQISAASAVRAEVRPPAPATRVAQVASTPRTPGTPGRASDAILAAKRAAAARLAEERKRQQELEKQMQDAELIDGDDIDVEQGPVVSPPPSSFDTVVSNSRRTAQELPSAPEPILQSPTPSVRSQSSATRIPLPSSSVPSSPRKTHSRNSSAAQLINTPPMASSHSPPASEMRAGISQKLAASTEMQDHNENATVEMSGTKPKVSSNGTPRDEAQLAPSDVNSKEQKADIASKQVSQPPIPLTPQKPNHTGAEKSAPKIDSTSASSTAVKWFLGKASRLDNVNAGESASELANRSPSKQRPDSAEHIAEVVQGIATLRTFKSLVALSKEFKLPEGEETQIRETALGLVSGTAADQLQQAMSMWQQDELFPRLFDAVLGYLDAAASAPPVSKMDNTAVPEKPRDKTREVHTAALVLLHRLVENQYALIASLDRERPMLEVLFKLVGGSETSGRSAAASSFKSGCQATLERWADHVDPIIGISLIRSLLVEYLRERRATNGSSETDAAASTNKVPSAAVPKWTLGLRGLGRLLSRLPAEIIEDQLQHCRETIKLALEDGHIELRQQAVAVLVTANKTLNDPPCLFAVLSPLDQAQEDLIMYYISKG